MTDLEGRVTFWNAGAERIYGWTAEEVLGRDVLDVTPAVQSRAEAEVLMERMLAGESWQGRFAVRRQDGTTFPALVSATPLADAEGRLVGIIGVSNDLTDLAEAEAGARRGKRHHAVADLARQGLHQRDLGEFLDRSVEVAASGCGAPLALLGQFDASRQAIHVLAGTGWAESPRGLVLPVPPRDLPSHPGRAERQRFPDGAGPELLRSHGVVAGLVATIPDEHGGFGLLAVYVTKTRTFTPDEVAFVDAVVGVVGGAVVRTSTEQELRRVAEQLRISDDIRLAFLRATSHELRTPLAAVRGFAETLQQHDRTLTPEQRSRYLDVLVDNAIRLDGLIQDLLDVDRLSSGLVTASPEPCRVDELVRGMVDVAGDAKHQVTLDLVEVIAWLDVAKVERMIHHLLVNALRHTPSGGTVTVRLTTEDQQVVLVVEDEGAGVDEDYLARIFDPFVQGPDQRESAAPGAGLGLALVREIAAMHGGTATACNIEGGGARFEVRLPVTPPV